MVHELGYLLIVIVIVLILIISIFYLVTIRILHKKGVMGKEIYSDMEIRSDSVLYSKSLGLVGKPDRITKYGGEYIVWEFKSRKAPDKPFENHVMQLTAYAVLVEEQFNTTVKLGILRYRDRTFKINITDELRKRLFTIIDEMQHFGIHGNLYRNHNNAARCVRCEYRDVCEYSLA